jgi:hypothetical protein
MRLLLEEHKAALLLGPGALAQLLSELCRKRAAKCLFRVGKTWKTLFFAQKTM